ncbi:unnamed protein product [Scytosiphon promiscuus]
MLEISRWTDAGQLLSLPPLSILVLHFVLVILPARLRARRRTDRGSAAAAAAAACEGGSARTAAATAASRTAASSPGDGKSGGISGPLAPSSAAGAPDTVSSRRPRGDGDSDGGSRGVRGGVGGNGSDGLATTTQLGTVPSYVFDAILPDDPAFYAEAKLCGSTIAYHGSSPENFHSIINTGLRVMSGTRRMKNGAAFGEGIYLSGSQNAAATFACRGDGSGTTVWPRSVFGDADGVADAAAASGAGFRGIASSTSPRHKKFRHRLVAKCRVLKGDGVKEIEGWGDEASYFVVSDESRVRVEELLLFHETQPSEQRAAAHSTPDRDRGGTSASSVSKSNGNRNGNNNNNNNKNNKNSRNSGGAKSGAQKATAGGGGGGNGGSNARRSGGGGGGDGEAGDVVREVLRRTDSNSSSMFDPCGHEGGARKSSRACFSVFLVSCLVAAAGALVVSDFV